MKTKVINWSEDEYGFQIVEILQKKGISIRRLVLRALVRKAGLVKEYNNKLLVRIHKLEADLIPEEEDNEEFYNELDDYSVKSKDFLHEVYQEE